MSDLPPFDPYEVLGIDKASDSATIKKAYRKLALIKHPDKCTDERLKDARTDEFQRLNEAYDILGDDEKRKRHDALVKLESLRKEKFSMGGPPRPFQRAATFQNAYPGATSTAYTSRGATNVEDRAPKGFYEDEDRYSRRPYADYDYARRSAGGTARTERARTDRRRDEQVRDPRARKYDETDRYAERESKREEPSREKYDSWEESLKAYTNRAEPRPSMAPRRTASREVPIYATRSRAAPKGRRGSDEDNIFEKERELEKEREHLARLKRQDAERSERQAREDERARREREAELERRYEREREAERQERAERQTRQREREERERRREQEERERERRPRQKENVEPYERRPPTLQHNNSSPPNFAEHPLPRVRTEPISSEAIPYPSMPRANTMPSVPISSSARRTTGPSKLRESAQPDSGYSSNSTNAEEPRSSRTAAKPVKVSNYYYTADGKPATRNYNVETVDPDPPTSRRRRSPSVERPTMERASSKMANLAKHASRPARDSYPLPTRTRSPERSSRRERDYPPRSARPLYGELPRTPSYDPDNVSWSKPITKDDISYSGSGRSRRAEKDAYGYSRAPGFDRRGTMPIPPMQ